MKKKAIITTPQNTIVPIIKVVGNHCNLRCRYCFYNLNDQSIPCLLKEELLEKFLEEYMELFNGRLLFIWHGGEPLLAGIPFFQKVVELQRKYIRHGHVVRNSIQTNATLVNDKWATFLKAHNFNVGVSIDGDEKSHDRFRITRTEKGSHNHVLKGIATFRHYGIDVGIIQTLTRSNTERITENFNFFLDILGAKSWGINVYFDPEQLNKAMSDQNVSNEDLTLFLKICIDLWLDRNLSHLRIREIENFIHGVFGKRAPNCTFNGSCTGFICLDYDGKIYPCDRLSNRTELSFGNLSKQSLVGILNSSKRLQYANDVNSNHQDCIACEWRNACHNGCASQRIGSIKGKYYYCPTRKEVFAYLKSKVNKHGFLTTTPLT
ncbi:MAG: radical SAM protein [Candidatus Wolfebacteria bacterium]|nr:radical SAM protein [Candidatus Wolfebacteria bacterium]